MTVEEELATLAVQIADATAMSDIQLFCPAEQLSTEPFDIWYDTAEVGDDLGEECVKRAVRYLDLKGELEHHPQNPMMVRHRA